MQTNRIKAIMSITEVGNFKQESHFPNKENLPSSLNFAKKLQVPLKKYDGHRKLKKAVKTIEAARKNSSYAEGASIKKVEGLREQTSLVPLKQDRYFSQPLNPPLLDALSVESTSSKKSSDDEQSSAEKAQELRTKMSLDPIEQDHGFFSRSGNPILLDPSITFKKDDIPVIDQRMDVEMVSLPSIPEIRPPKDSTFHYDFFFQPLSKVHYEEYAEFNKKLIKILKYCGIPYELKEVCPEKCDQSYPSDITLHIKLSWRELKALADKLPILNRLLESQGIRTERLRPVETDRQAEDFVYKVARKALGNSSDHHAKTPEWNLPLGISSYNEILSSGLTTFQGLCFGEWHNDPKQFLIDHMEHIKSCGVKILFMEHLMYDTMQIFLDKYFTDGKDAEMPLPLAAYLRSLDVGFDLEESDYNFTALVEAAKKHGVRVVGIDTSLSYEAGHSMYGSSGVDRYLGMNHAAKEIIDYEAGLTEKFIALMGNYHGTTVTVSGQGVDISSEESVPGVAELLEVPFITLEKSDENSNLIQQNVYDYLGGISFVNMVISGYQFDKGLTFVQSEPDEEEDEEI